MFDSHHLLDMIHKTPESEMEMLRDEEFESKSGTDIMEAPLSGDDDQDQDHDPNQRPKKKRYHRHTQNQIQEMESWAFPLVIILNYQHFCVTENNRFALTFILRKNMCYFFKDGKCISRPALV